MHTMNRPNVRIEDGQIVKENGGIRHAVALDAVKGRLRKATAERIHEVILYSLNAGVPLPVEHGADELALALETNNTYGDTRTEYDRDDRLAGFVRDRDDD